MDSTGLQIGIELEVLLTPTSQLEGGFKDRGGYCSRTARDDARAAQVSRVSRV
jgi:hypothetical protein